MAKNRLGSGALPSAETCNMRFIKACDALKELQNRLYGLEADYKTSLRVTGGIPVTVAQGRLGGLVDGVSEAIGVFDAALRVNARASKPRKPKKP